MQVCAITRKWFHFAVCALYIPIYGPSVVLYPFYMYISYKLSIYVILNRYLRGINPKHPIKLSLMWTQAVMHTYMVWCVSIRFVHKHARLIPLWIIFLDHVNTLFKGYPSERCKYVMFDLRPKLRCIYIWCMVIQFRLCINMHDWYPLWIIVLNHFYSSFKGYPSQRCNYVMSYVRPVMHTYHAHVLIYIK